MCASLQGLDRTTVGLPDGCPCAVSEKEDTVQPGEACVFGTVCLGHQAFCDPKDFGVCCGEFLR